MLTWHGYPTRPRAKQNTKLANIHEQSKTRAEQSSRLVWSKSSQLPYGAIWWQIGWECSFLLPFSLLISAMAFTSVEASVEASMEASVGLPCRPLWKPIGSKFPTPDSHLPTPDDAKNGKPQLRYQFEKNLYLGWNPLGLWVSGTRARTIRNFSLEISPDLFLLDIRKSTFQHLTVNFITSWSQNLPYGPSPIEQPFVFNIYISHYPSQKQKNENRDLGFPNTTNVFSLKWQGQTQIFRKRYQSLGLPIEINAFHKNEQNKNRNIPYFLCSFSFHAND